MAKEGVMREQGFRAKERYVPLSYPSAPQTRAARSVFPSLSSWQLEKQEAICSATRCMSLRAGHRGENDKKLRPVARRELEGTCERKEEEGPRANGPKTLGSPRRLSFS